MKKVNIIYTIMAVLIVLGTQSCKKEPVVGGTATQALAGEWWVKFDNGTGEDGSGYFTLNTYNTAANIPTEMWFDDGYSTGGVPFWEIKGKISCNVANLTFSGTNIANQDYPSTFTVTNGKILRNAATAPGSKDKTDSIYCNITFSDDDPSITTPHILSGYKRTGFAQDDH